MLRQKMIHRIMIHPMMIFRTIIQRMATALLIGCIMFPTVNVYADNTVKLIINGVEITGLPMPPTIYQDSVLVPAREVFENLGASVMWVSETRAVYILYDDQQLMMTIDKKTAYLNGSEKQMAIQPLIMNGKTMIPLRFPSECFGFEVKWLPEERAACINTPAEITEPIEPDYIPDYTPEENNVITPNDLPEQNDDADNENVNEDDADNEDIDNGDVDNENVNEDDADNEDIDNSDADNGNIDNGDVDNEDINNGNTDNENVDNGTVDQENSDASANDTVPGVVDTEDEIGITAPPPVSIGNEHTVLAQDKTQAAIPKVEYPLTSITQLLTPLETKSSSYTIVASSAISEVQKQLLQDNRLVIDIYNAQNELTGPFYTDTSVPVSEVRASQFMDMPKVTRLVFDITGAAAYTVTLSEDRTMLTVSFMRNTITDITFSTTGTGDTLTITGTGTPSITIYPLTEPNRILICIANAVMSSTSDETVNGAFVTEYHAWQEDEAMGYIEAYVRAFSSYDLEYGPNSVIIRFFPRTYTNISYDSFNRTLSIPKSSGLNMSIDAIRHNDDYTNLRYVLTLPVNAEAFIGHGELIIRDNFIHSIMIAIGEEGLTQLIINEARVLAFIITEDDAYYYIKVRLPKEVYNRVVVIDPGHGGEAPGTIQNGLIEKNINLSIGLKLMSLLDADPNIKAYATRLTDVNMPLETRPLYANLTGDMFVSIHANSVKGNSSVNGIETWYCPHNNDALLGFSSYQLAEIIHRNLIASTGANDRNIKTDELIVLRDTVIPAVLCETGFLSNSTEAAKLATDAYQWQIARALYNGIVEAFTVYRPRQ